MGTYGYISIIAMVCYGFMLLMFLTASNDYSYLSSTTVKEIASFGGDIKQFVPREVCDKVYEKYGIKER